ncbi:putative phage abortive infection protein [Pseudomonas sp. B21-044]|uniref:putative phage abortive infection protein n=1 Tax=Pseudomonas sp. B21-044 TaxID=2895488 RepID=UPI00215E9455|nr:putative phage abortive infection protein [Pseudomonas sp. B21-044]UVL17457.1 putative phage abortive infection protein [Pseudomonas sp. B21-044]
MDDSNWFVIQKKVLSHDGVFSYVPPLISYVEDSASFSSLGPGVYLGSLFFVLLLTGFICFLLKVTSGRLSNSWKVSGVLVLVMFLYVSYFVMLLWSTPFAVLPEKLREGAFGDSFGTLNALFSGLAFSGVLITMLLQRKDLLEARVQASNQQIESQFYNMLALQQNIVSGFDMKSKGVLLHSGRDCFKAWYRFFESQLQEEQVSPGLGVEEAYDIMWLKYQGDLGLYFRSLYSIFRFVSECGHPDAAKFGGVVRSLLSDFELVILYYNCLSKQGSGFKKFVEEFRVFDNLDVDMLVDVGELTDFDVRCFGDNESALNLYCILSQHLIRAVDGQLVMKTV